MPDLGMPPSMIFHCRLRCGITGHLHCGMIANFITALPSNFHCGMLATSNFHCGTLANSNLNLFHCGTLAESDYH
jgi:hypothetical protein